ncbi:alpha/beta hydrolase fold-containing protein [Ahrensia sp. R2A130]|nr:alpha/beta hydrolase fold-containing protein [Ahrensia sp. R2A130]
MWGDEGVVGRHFYVERIWRGWCGLPHFSPMPSGHFIPEEAPNDAFTALIVFSAFQRDIASDGKRSDLHPATSLMETDSSLVEW